ncbi:hypothetical protein BDBG_02221 [Blastomyces gilchristii SLH14081]|uniref:Uncharacterized protein n=2 Tax=Blastomyces gilchristii (strain SLH14081) TaxID=559298 RepID=A0A179UF50_BLAGS|nr:uncharacterized protein BDBG_02221 [Blastomyces gilchristii SLH14081]OAT05908.1 hypothetical protein BDBG_02221 [Blastomyces gilchristii SLH14081]
MPSLHVVLKLGHRPATLQVLRAMRNSSDSPDHPVPGGRLGDLWTIEQDQSLLKLREEHDYMNLEDFQKAFFHDRSRYAVSKRLSVLKRAGQQKASLGNSPLAGGSNSPRRQPSTIEYIYSDDESQAMSLDSRLEAEEVGGECTSEQRTSSQTDDVSNPVLSNTLKRKPSVDNGASRPSPSKLSRVPTVPIFASTELCSTAFPYLNTPTTSNANTVVDVTDNPNNHNHRNNTQVSIFNSRSTWMDLRDEDILHMYHQAKKCTEETRRAEALELKLSSSNDILTRCRDENRALLDLQKQHDDELEETMENLLKERKAEQKQLKAYNEAKLKLLEQMDQLKTEFNKIKVGASKVIHPGMWKSGGMDAAAAQVIKLAAQIEETLKVIVSSETRSPSQVPSGDHMFLGTPYLEPRPFLEGNGMSG